MSDEFKQRLLMLVRAELPDATFQLGRPSCFEWDGTFYSTDARLAEEEGFELFKLTDELAERIYENAKARSA